MTQEDDLLERVARAIRDVACPESIKNNPAESWDNLAEFRREILRSSARAAIAECYRWRPIEEAPKDGRSLLLINGYGDQVVGYWLDLVYEWRIHKAQVTFPYVTHFRLLGPAWFPARRRRLDTDAPRATRLPGQKQISRYR